MRNQNYKQKEKKSHSGKKTVNNRVVNESADQLSCFYYI